MRRTRARRQGPGAGGSTASTAGGAATVRVATAVAVVGALLAGGALLLVRRPQGEIRATLSLTEALAPAATEGFARALSPPELSFPADHGPHPDFQTEWWYVTGNLESGGGRRFGYQITLFRSSLTAQPPERASAWATSQVFMGHLGLTDVAAERFFSFERFSRAALGLAGARAEPLRVWLDDWTIASTGPDTFPLRIRAAEAGTGIDLLLERGKPVVLQGDRGLSQKGSAPGNASYYYSLTRLPSRGEIRHAGGSFSVTGSSWMDREWSTSALNENQEGWDWFALQLSDGRELMFYRLRRRDGSTDPLSRGSVVESDGSYRTLAAGDVRLEVLDFWSSPRTAARYPARWRLSSPEAGVELRVTPYLSDQEHRTSVVYWEGAVRVEGRSRGREVAGSGYVELTGYTPQDRLPRGEAATRAAPTAG